jgi:GT2 family glycosyltransferase
MPDLAIIIVSWNVRDLLRRCLQSVVASLAGSGISYELLVVDNAGGDDTPAMLRAEFPQVRLLEPGHNLGFAGANNLALRELGYRGQVTGDRVPAAEQQLPDGRAQSPVRYVLLLNPDTEVVGAALPRLVAYLAAHPEVIAVGPQLRYADGSIQSSRRRFPTRLTFFWESTLLERLWPGNPSARRYHCADRSAELEQRVDWLVGAALLVRGPAIAHAGLLDEQFFMYSEELEWQWRLQGTGYRGQGTGYRGRRTGDTEHGIRDTGYGIRDTGYGIRDTDDSSRIVYLPDAVVRHYEGRSSEQVPAGRHLHFQRSKLRLARRMYGALFAEVLRIFLLLGYCWELLIEAGKYLLGHRRTLRRRRIGVYLTVLRTGLR